MSNQSRQWMRLTKFIEELKKNKYPTVRHMLKVLRDADIDEGMPCSCSERTFRRDMDTLRDDYHAPIAFDYKKKGFYLTDPTWQFDVPVFSTPKIKAHVDAKVLRKLFDAHRTHRVVAFNYAPPNGKELKMIFEPHIITLFNGIWYVRGRERQIDERRTYAVQRISDVVFSKDTFKPDRQLIADTKKNGPFDLPKIENAVVRVDADATFFFRERAEAAGYVIKKEKDGTTFVYLPPMIESEIIRFVLSGCGSVCLEKPQTLREKIATVAQTILSRL